MPEGCLIVTTTLYRTVELLSGQITIDGVDISKIGLTDLRQALASTSFSSWLSPNFDHLPLPVIPQEPLLFSGDLRSNLDPFGQYDDAILWDALKRSWLLDASSSKLPSSSASSAITAYEEKPNKFTLDTKIEEGGANLSVGEVSVLVSSLVC